MPVYEYKCTDCQEVFEEQRPVDARHEPAVCPKCLMPLGTLVPSLGSFILKGAGWTGGHGPGNSSGP